MLFSFFCLIKIDEIVCNELFFFKFFNEIKNYKNFTYISKEFEKMENIHIFILYINIIAYNRISYIYIFIYLEQNPVFLAIYSIFALIS